MKWMVTVKGVFATVALMLTACASTPPPHSKPENTVQAEQVLMCHGTKSAEGYPFGKSSDSPGTMVLVLTKDAASIRVGGVNGWLIGSGGKFSSGTSSPPPMCSPKTWQDSHCERVDNNSTPPTFHLNCTPGEWHSNVCEAKHDGDTLRITFFEHQSGINKLLVFNQKTGEMMYGSGGMDGGWSFKGICKPE